MLMLFFLVGICINVNWSPGLPPMVIILKPFSVQFSSRCSIIFLNLRSSISGMGWISLGLPPIIILTQLLQNVESTGSRLFSFLSRGDLISVFWFVIWFRYAFSAWSFLLVIDLQSESACDRFRICLYWIYFEICLPATAHLFARMGRSKA